MQCFKRPLTYVLNTLNKIPVWFFVLALPLLGFCYTIDKERLLKIAQNLVKERYGNTYKVEDLIYFSPKVELPDKPITFEVEKVGTTLYLEVIDLTDGRKISQIPLKVGYVKTVVVPVRTIEAGQVLTKEDLKKVKKVFPYPPKGFITDIDFAVGKIAKVTLKEGQPIRKYQLEDRYSIFPGQEVKIIFRKPFLEIQTQGIALDRGKVGSQIRVRYRNKIFLGRVENENTVVIELP